MKDEVTREDIVKAIKAIKNNATPLHIKVHPESCDELKVKWNISKGYMLDMLRQMLEEVDEDIKGHEKGSDRRAPTKAKGG